MSVSVSDCFTALPAKPGWTFVCCASLYLCTCVCVCVFVCVVYACGVSVSVSDLTALLQNRAGASSGPWQEMRKKPRDDNQL